MAIFPSVNSTADTTAPARTSRHAMRASGRYRYMMLKRLAMMTKPMSDVMIWNNIVGATPPERRSPTAESMVLSASEMRSRNATVITTPNEKIRLTKKTWS